MGTNENSYVVQFATGASTLVYATNAVDAVKEARAQLHGYMARWTNHTELGAASARKAVYGEWDCDTHHYLNDGTHLTH